MVYTGFQFIPVSFKTGFTIELQDKSFWPETKNTFQTLTVTAIFNFKIESNFKLF